MDCALTRIPYNHIYTNKMCHLHAYHTITFTPTRCVIYTHTIQSHLHQQDVSFTRIPYNHIYTNKMCYLTRWIRVTHICVSKQTRIGSNNGLSPSWRQAIIWTNAGILFIGPLGTNFNEISIEIHILSFKKMHLKMSSGEWRPFCLGLNVINIHSRH